MLVSPYKGVANGESGRDGTVRREVNELDGGESASDFLMEPFFSESDPTASDVSRSRKTNSRCCSMSQMKTRMRRLRRR